MEITSKIIVRNVNATYVKLICDNGIAFELYEHFSFKVPNAKFDPRVKSGYWDGVIHLFSTRSRLIYKGLLKDVEAFAKSNNYQVLYEQEQYSNEFSLTEADQYIQSINPKFEPRYYQKEIFLKTVREKNRIFISPTASGKSLAAYLICRYFENKKVLLIVPTVNLVNQMYTDFEEYSENNSWSPSDLVHRIHEGQSKETSKPIIISTWQSIYDMPAKWFEKFDVVIGDEVHTFKAKSLKAIMENCVNAEYRIGMTGSLDGSLTNEMVLRGLFGQIDVVATTPELAEQGFMAKSVIKCLMLKHPKEVCKAAQKLKYQEEIEYLISSDLRNKFIRNLALSLNGNTMILFNFVEKHGKVLYEMLQKKLEGTNRKVYYIHGGVDAVDRETVRKLIETEENAIIVASVGTFSTGVNMKRLHNLIFAAPTKSRTRVIQSIGRGLRLADDKEKAIIFDIADDLRYNIKVNTTLKHFLERVKFYNQEGHTYKVYKIELKK